jgi:segregation and condensation protein A
MSYAVKLEKFEGPLDLLLELIEAERMDISSVSLATVTDSYVRYVEDHPEIPPEEMADFLVVASKLLFIKSRALLPFLQAVEDEAGGDLETQLRIYKEYLDASNKIAAMIGAKRFLFARDKLPRVDIGFVPPERFGTAQMEELFRAALRKLEPLLRLPKAIIEKTVSIQEKIQHIRALLRNADSLRFRDIASSAETRIEIVVSFLALLELVKQRMVDVKQEKRFADIMIARSGSM